MLLIARVHPCASPEPNLCAKSLVYIYKYSKSVVDLVHRYPLVRRLWFVKTRLKNQLETPKSYRLGQPDSFALSICCPLSPLHDYRPPLSVLWRLLNLPAREESCAEFLHRQERCRPG